MSNRLPPKFATALLRVVAASKPALIGDLLEQLRSGRSGWWYWRQVLAIVGRAVLCEVRGSIWWSGAAIMAAVLVLDLPLVIRSVGYSPGPVDPRRLLLMTFFLAPQALVIAVPVGLTVGMVVGSRSQVSSRILPVILMFAVFASVVTFAMQGWVVPASNQAYRFAAVQWVPMRGAGELNVVELHSLLNASGDAIRRSASLSDRWDVTNNYYARFSMSCSPIAFALFGVWTATLGRVSRRLLVVTTACAYVALFLVVDPQQARAFSPFMVAWFPTLSVAVAALLVRCASPERPSLTSQTS
jgi:lipopolysaccharide export LptBFGC system permease protein LptF